MIALVAIAVSAVGWLSYRSLEQALLPRVLDRIETNSRLVATDLESHVRSARGDIATFRGLAAVTGLMRAHLNGGIDPIDGTTEALWRERLGRPAGGPDAAPSRRIHCASSASRITIGKSFASIARARTAPFASSRKPSCKRVGDAPYFRDTIKLAADADLCLAGPFDRGRTASSRRRRSPIMQIAMPVMTADGKPYGIVIVERRHATGAGPRPVVGAAGRNRLSGRRQGRLSGPPRSRQGIRLAARHSRPTGGATCPISRACSAPPKASRCNPASTDNPAASRSRLSCWPAANGSRSSSRSRERSSWRRRRGSRTARSPSD